MPAPVRALTLSRPGEAKATDPQAAVAAPGGMLEEAQGMVAAAAAAVPLRPAAPLMTKPRKPLLQQVNIRLPVELVNGMEEMSHYTGRTYQDFITQLVERGLDEWHAGWRSLRS